VDFVFVNANFYLTVTDIKANFFVVDGITALLLMHTSILHTYVTWTFL
jgi:hypothetical protein